MAEFELQVIVDCKPEAAIQFLKTPENLLRISPAELNLHFLSTPEIFEHGSEFQFEVTGFGQTQRATHRITEMEALAFTEEQIEGAMKKFVAHHWCERTTDDSTLITERIEFKPPGGLLGLVATAERIKSHMLKAFEYRHATLKNLLENC